MKNFPTTDPEKLEYFRDGNAKPNLMRPMGVLKSQTDQQEKIRALLETFHAGGRPGATLSQRKKREKVRLELLNFGIRAWRQK
jgi:hypothetical protein